MEVRRTYEEDTFLYLYMMEDNYTVDVPDDLFINTTELEVGSTVQISYLMGDLVDNVIPIKDMYRREMEGFPIPISREPENPNSPIGQIIWC